LFAALGICVLIPSGILILIAVIKRVKSTKERLEQKNQNLTKEIQSLTNEHQHNVQALQLAHQKEIQNFLDEHQGKVQVLKSVYQKEIHDLTSAKLEILEKAQMERWFQCLAKSPWRHNAPEVEIEAKFIFPLLKHLGYAENEMELRVPVLLKEGSRESRLEVDWLLRHDVVGALVVVEAKAPEKQLTENVRRQARSYAFHLETPVYIVTNGKELRIFHRGVLKDSCVLSCKTNQLKENWRAIYQVAGKSAVMTLKDQLSK
jgi:hypothetical protein